MDNKLEGREESCYGRSTALFGLLDAQARVDWAVHMLAVLAGSAELGDLHLSVKRPLAAVDRLTARETMNTITQAVRRLFGGEDSSAAGPVQAIWNGAVLAASARAVRLEGNHYFPPEDVNDEYLEPSPRQSVCPWKGRARYYDAVVNGRRNPGAAWYYSKPSPFAKRISNHVAFWQGVEVRPAVRGSSTPTPGRRGAPN